MKRLCIMLFIASICSLGVSAQSNFVGTATNPTGAILNATVDTLQFTMSGQYNEVMTIQTLATKTSGTMAGTVRLYGSNFNVAGTWDAVSDTLTLTNAATNDHTWTLQKPCYKYYMILQSGGTTVAGFLYAKAYAIKPN